MNTLVPSKSGSSYLSQELHRYFSNDSSADIPGTADYLERGAALISSEAVAELRRLLPELYRRIARVDDSLRLRIRLGILARYFEEAGPLGRTDDATYRETTFALLYFLKGFDRIPDSIPEIGLLDDALIVQTVLQKQASVLRAHWLHHGRSWPREL